MEIWSIEIKNMYISICYFVFINFIFYKENNLDKNCPYKILEQDIDSNEYSIFFLGDFNVRISTINQAIILSNDSNPNLLWLDEDLVLANR